MTPPRLNLPVLLAAFALGAAAHADGTPVADKPVIVLVHGAFAESSSWSAVIETLAADGYDVRAAANPLRSVRTDADEVAGLVAGIDAPVVLVGHSYGGSVVSDAAADLPNVKALVYVAAFAPDLGETAAGLAAKLPGSTLGPALAPPALLAGGGKDLYIKADRFHDQFAADLPLAEARLMAATQRPIAEAAFNEPQDAAAWKAIPSWFVYGDADRNIPPKLYEFMAERAHARRVVRVEGASHVVMVSHPALVAEVIEEAAGVVQVAATTATAGD